MAERASRKSVGSQPISRHPLFPVIVALWFGALFGLCSLAIKPALIEQAVLATGIDSVLSMAAPPLGATARMLIALAMTGLGGVVGTLIARRIARPETEARERRRGVVSADRDDTAIAITDRESEAEAPEAPRRALAWKPRKAEPEPVILSVAEFDLTGFDAPSDAPSSEAIPVEDAPDEQVSAEEPPPAGNSLFDTYSRKITGRVINTLERPDEASQEAFHAPPELLAPPLGEAMAGPASGAAESESGKAAERIASAELEALSHVELLERLALAMVRRREENAAARLPDISEPEAEYGEEAEPRSAVDEPLALEPAEIVLPRFEPAAEDFEDPASAGEEIEAAPALPRVPAALRPVGHDSSDDDDVLPGYIPPRHISLAPAEDYGNAAYALDEHDEESEDDESEVLEEGYSSLLNLSRSAPRAPLEGIAPPEAGETDEADLSDEAPGESKRPFDAPGGPDVEETEKALRAALATLQRMSGAA